MCLNKKTVGAFIGNIKKSYSYKLKNGTQSLN